VDVGSIGRTTYKLLSCDCVRVASQDPEEELVASNLLTGGFFSNICFFNGTACSIVGVRWFAGLSLSYSEATPGLPQSYSTSRGFYHALRSSKCRHCLSNFEMIKTQRILLLV
jgi:hypothetical protein